MKNIWKHICICLFLFISPELIAQQVVTGQITDAADGTPITGASIFVANTTLGTASDLSGNYSFTVPGRGSFEIVVSHVGYQSVFHKVEIPQNAHQFDVALEINELEEITVRAARTYKKSDVDLFWRRILGEKPSKNGMEVLNPEKIYFYKSGHILKASCREPIEIINHHTGYHIRYVLMSFEYDYSEERVKFEGMSSFEELTPRNSRQKDRWETKRNEVYAVSLNRFLRALYRKQIREEGFVLADQNIHANDGKIFPVPLDNMVIMDHDTASVYIRMPLFLLCYSKPVTTTMLSEGYWNDIFDNKPVYISSINTGMPGSAAPPIVFASGGTGNSVKGAPIVVELLPSQISIYSDGTYRGLLRTREYGHSLIALSSLLPVEYTETIQTNSYALTVLQSYSIEQAEENITNQLEVYPQEKIHLHTDRDVYIPGEKIWFKAYITDANSHQYAVYSEDANMESDEANSEISNNYSWYVYAELISPADSLVSRVMITQTANDMFYGYLPISNNIPEGNYTLRAYTQYMENLGDDYFFKKNIRIGKLSKENDVAGRYAERGEIGENIINQNNPVNPENRGSDFDITFYPEGGNLPEGVISKIAFKALSRTGYPESVSGYLIDETGIEITPIQTYHAGMGVFSFLPESGKKYRLKCTNEHGLEKLFELPLTNPQAYSLTVTGYNNSIMIDAQKSVRSPDIPCYLLVHCRGTVIYFSEWANQEVVSFDAAEFPAGVIQLMLFDGQMNPLSERLIFSKNDASIPLDFHTGKDAYQIRDKIVATLSFPDSLFYSHTGHFSIAVTDDRDIAVDESVTILSSLLLSSEIKGYIENPAYYLQDDVAMDLLMMTHGWRRYNMPEVVKGRLDHPQIPFQLFQEISGRVMTIVLDRPVRDSEIRMLIKSEEGSGFGSAITDINGSFSVQDMVFPDSTTFYIQALSKNGREDIIKLIVDSDSFPALIYAPQSPLSRLTTKAMETNDEYDINAFMQKAKQQLKFEEDIWMLYLDEVVVSAPKIERRNESRSQYWANSSSEVTITREEIERSNYLNVSDYISWIKTIYFQRGPITFNAGTELLFLIDGMPVNDSDPPVSLDDLLFVGAIESIDIFKGTSTAVFGSSGANGVISITTKKESGINNFTLKPNNLIYNPIGYQKPVEFYAPKYETLETRQSKIPDYRTTIYWKPDIAISDAGEARLEFYTSDLPTTYSIVIEGLTDDGKIIRQIEKIQVK